MGLGKTIQIIALLVRLRHEGKAGKHPPSLLIVPASLLANWKSELARFAPDLRTAFLHPSETPAIEWREAAAGESLLVGKDIALTTYGQAVRLEWLAARPWRLLVLDEAQAIKNPGARQTRAVKRLQAHARVALTGTPVENRLGDLWSLFDFLNPGLLGNASQFSSLPQAPARRHAAGLCTVAAARAPLPSAAPQDRPHHHRRPSRQNRADRMVSCSRKSRPRSTNKA